MKSLQRVKTYQDIRFIFIGDGDDKAALENKAKKEGLKNIDFVGFKQIMTKFQHIFTSQIYIFQQQDGKGSLLPWLKQHQLAYL